MSQMQKLMLPACLRRRTSDWGSSVGGRTGRCHSRSTRGCILSKAVDGPDLQTGYFSTLYWLPGFGLSGVPEWGTWGDITLSFYSISTHSLYV